MIEQFNWGSPQFEGQPLYFVKQQYAKAWEPPVYTAFLKPLYTTFQ